MERRVGWSDVLAHKDEFVGGYIEEMREGVPVSRGCISSILEQRGLVLLTVPHFGTCDATLYISSECIAYEGDDSCIRVDLSFCLIIISPSRLHRSNVHAKDLQTKLLATWNPSLNPEDEHDPLCGRIATWDPGESTRIE